jgi:predicted CxxxxCH...CXXCH cytochrome family protein
VNGVVDVGDGGTGCGSCHGAGGDDAWPRTGSHDGHRAPTVTTETPCADCHPVPMNIDDAGHLDATVQVALGGRAAARGVTPSYDAAVGGTCVVACHGAGIDGGAVPMPRWRLPAEVAGRCDACHGVPPASSHPVPGSCASILCHGGEIGETPGGPRITETGRLVHIDGVIDVGGGG